MFSASKCILTELSSACHPKSAAQVYGQVELINSELLLDLKASAPGKYIEARIS